jgi:GNAT superfamily N-acetyltransferase
MMRELINENKANVGVVLAREGTYIVGWSFIAGPCIGCYVDPMYRRQGIGQKLVKQLKTGTRKRFVVSLHDTKARKFYGGMGARVDYVEAAKRPDWILNGVMTK